MKPWDRIKGWFGQKNKLLISDAPVFPERVSMMVVFEEGQEMLWETSSIQDRELSWKKSVCPYCGVGCGLLVGEKEGKVIKVRGNPEHPSNLGLICAKGATLPQILYTPDRVLFPQMRTTRTENFSRSNWEDITTYLANRIQSTVERCGPDSFAFYISGQLLTEDYYVINKFAKGFLGTNNVDSNSRLCMASAVAGYTTSLGADGPPTCYADIEVADGFFLIGTNTAACHPVTFQRIKMQKIKNPEAKVIVADPRRTRTTEIADLYLPLKAGTDVALLNGMLHVMIREGYLDRDFIRNYTDGWNELEERVKTYTPEKTGEICGLPPKDVCEAGILFGKSKATLSFWSMGLNQSSHGVAKNNAVINLHLATGKIGKPGCGPFSLTGQPNAMGGRETGGLAHLLPAHRSITQSDDRREMEEIWKTSPNRISKNPGLSAIELFQALHRGKVKIIWIIATNPMVSIPNLSLVKSALEEAELVIVSDVYHPTETTQQAHVLLPAAQWSERDGTVTSSERRISYLEKVADPPGEALSDWKIICEVAKKMGFGEAFSYSDAESIYEEYKYATRGRRTDVSGVTYDRLKREPLQWPCVGEQGISTARLYTDGKFPTSDGKARFIAHAYLSPAEIPDEKFPMILTTGRVRDQWHTMTRTGKVESLLKRDPRPFIELSLSDADRYGVKDKQMIQIVTRRGNAKAIARITSQINTGTCFMPFHWGALFGSAVVNECTIDVYDALSKQPELKFCACRIDKVEAEVTV